MHNYAHTYIHIYLHICIHKCNHMQAVTTATAQKHRFLFTWSGPNVRVEVRLLIVCCCCKMALVALWYMYMYLLQAYIMSACISCFVAPPLHTRYRIVLNSLLIRFVVVVNSHFSSASQYYMCNIYKSSNAKYI